MACDEGRVVTAAGAESGRELALLVGLGRGDGRDEGLRAFYGLGGRGLRVDGGRTSTRDKRTPRRPRGKVAGNFLCACSFSIYDARVMSRPCAVTPLVLSIDVFCRGFSRHRGYFRPRTDFLHCDEPFPIS